MRSFLALAFLPLLVAAAPDGPQRERLAGNWSIDLRPELSDVPYTQPMTIAVAADGAVSGTFYGSEIVAGRAGSGQGRLCLAFRTSDGSGNYNSSASLLDGKLVGQTWSEGRSFVLPWSAERR